MSAAARERITARGTSVIAPHTTGVTGLMMPAFSACAGLLTYALRAQSTGTAPTVPGEMEASRFGRLGSWLRENF